MSTEYFDTVIIGAGHNALVCAAYLARAGQKVAIVERRSAVGGACVSEELVNGYQFSTASLVTSLFQQSIIEDLNLRSHGLAVMPRSPSVTSLVPDGSHLILGRDPESDAAEIAKFSGRDAAQYSEYGDMMHRLWSEVKSLFTGPSREPVASNPEQLRSILHRAVDMSDSDLRNLFSVMFDSARNHLDSWFESEAVKAPLAIDGITGVAAGPSSPGTAYLMLYHHAGSTERGHVRGGMGG
ncbi:MULTISPECIES: phytoene desaturase family protein [unclassified Pseudonocardia]|uniref:phytoene desaturase family protein n=1 Tax=unclassified Pseudonocardia TaxID=2619320 RepID=UPI00143A2E43|nr:MULTISPECIES: NAD(P)/FAD-dependent oxidoreductase [unclassified Pseudonocardia]